MRDSNQKRRLVRAEETLTAVAVGENLGRHWDFLLEANKSFGLNDEEALELTIRESGSREEFITTQERRARERLIK